MQRNYCDVCKKEIKRNVVKERLVARFGNFIAEVVISKDGISDNGDLCLECLLKNLIKPKRKYERKPKLGDTKVINGTLCFYVKAGADIIVKDASVTTITPELREMEEGLNSEGLTLLKPTRKKVKGGQGAVVTTEVITPLKPTKTEVSPEIFDTEGDDRLIIHTGSDGELDIISTFTIHTPEPGKGGLTVLSMGGIEVEAPTLKQGALELLDKLGLSIGDIEHTLESEGRKELLIILDEGENPTP